MLERARAGVGSSMFEAIHVIGAEFVCEGGETGDSHEEERDSLNTRDGPGCFIRDIGADTRPVDRAGEVRVDVGADLVGDAFNC